MHSIYLLRSFNDPIAMFFMHSCILFAIKHKWKRSVLFYSLALSIKMNILLYLPGFLLVVNWAKNYLYTLFTLAFIVMFQLAIAAPFLLVNAEGYFSRAFDFSRVFLFKESAYWQFLPEHVFVSSKFHSLLLFLHLAFLLIFLFRKAANGSSLKEKFQSLNLPTSIQEFLNPGPGSDLQPESKN